MKKREEKVLLRNCEKLEVNKCSVVRLFKHVENKSQNCFVEHLEHFVFPFPSFLLTPNLWPRYTIQSLYDLTIYGLICVELVNEQAYGNTTCAIVMRVNT